MNVNCPVSSTIVNTPEYKALKDKFGSSVNNNDDILLHILNKYREDNGLEYTWYPSTEEELTKFADCVEENKPGNKAKIKTQQELLATYQSMYNTFTPEQLRTRITDIAYRFWRCVNALEKNDRTNRSRQELIESYEYKGVSGYKGILSYIFDEYANWASEDYNFNNFIEIKKNEGFDTSNEKYQSMLRNAASTKAEAWKPVVENKEMLAALALTKIGEVEGFVVRTDGFETDLSEISEEDFDDGVLEGGEDKEETDDNDGSKGDRYSDYRTTKLMDQLSAQFRNIIFGIPQYDASGNIVKNDLLVENLLDIRTTAVKLKEIALNSTPDSFLQDIQDACTETPWLLGVYKRLENNPADTAVVYSAVKGNEVRYIATIFDEATRSYKTIVVNSKARGKAMMAEAGKNLSGGLNGYDKGYSLVDDDGAIVSLSELEDIKNNISDIFDKIIDFTETITILDDFDFNSESSSDARHKKVIDNLVKKYGGTADDYAYLKEGGVVAMKGFLDQNPDICTEIARHLRGMGFDVNADNIYDSAISSIGTSDKAKKYWGVKDRMSYANKLHGMVNSMIAPVERAISIKKKDDSATGEDIYTRSTDEFAAVNKYVALSKINDLERRIVNEGKSLQAITNVNLLHQTFDKLSKMTKEQIASEILPYEGMGLGFGENLRPTGWLNGYTHMLKVDDSCGFNHREYGSMSSQQHMTNALLNYFMPPSWQGGPRYEVCIQSDYGTAYNFVEGPKFDKDKLVDMASDEVLIELERWASIQERIKQDPDRVKYKVYEEQGQQIHIFPELNSNGFLQEWKTAKEVGPVEALAVVKRHVSEQLNKIADVDAEYFAKKGIFNNKRLQNVKQDVKDKPEDSLHFYSKDGSFESLGEREQEAFKLMSMNYYYARQQITKLTVGDLSHFDGLSDFEKRNMMAHAPHTSIYARADNEFAGKNAGITSQKVLYVDDDRQASAYMEYNKKALEKLYKDKKIPEDQYKRMLESFNNMKDTDGQGFRSLESRRRIDIASGKWGDKEEKAYWRLNDNKATAADYEVLFNPEKPVYSGYDYIPAARAEHQKPVRATVLHKYSEVTLIPEKLSGVCIQAQSTPMRAMSRIADEQGIDLVLFTSGVKVGAFSVVKPFAKNENGDRLLETEDELVKFMTDEIKSHPSAIHNLSLEGFGIAASIAGHGEDDRISVSTQAEKECYADVESGEMTDVEVNGKKVDTVTLRTIHYQTKAEDTKELFKKLQSLFSNSDELARAINDEIKTKSYYSNEMKFAIEQLKEGGTAMPLFSPNIRHNVEQLMASIINKRLTKPRFPGANIPEATAFGIDVDSAPFKDTVDFPKLEIKYSDEADGVHRKYIEVYTTVYDSAFEEYADENGVITPERLWGKDGTGETEGLVYEGKIPREALEFVAYRTPSDYVHSLFNCRIKGFVAKTGGQVLYMPKDCMISDGHDYDGDKKRCHFPNIRDDWDEEKIKEAYDAKMRSALKDVNVWKFILGTSNDEPVPYEAFARWIKSDANPDRAKYRKIFYDAYDFNSDAGQNSMAQRHNGRIRMMFSVLSSAAGTSRAMIPGEFEETKVLAKTMYIIRNANENVTGELKKVLDSHKSVESLYKYLKSLSDKKISELMKDLNKNVSPFSMKHAADSYEYIMGPADMIAIYAMYGSTAMMLQRAHLSYEPKDANHTVTIFGKPIENLYEVRDRTGHYASMGRSHLLNAAVDNPKDAILGFLNQTQKLSALTNFLQAAGYTEEDIHLLMNQPAVIQLSEEAAEIKDDFLGTVITDIVNRLTMEAPFLAKYKGKKSEELALQRISTLTPEDCINMLKIPFSDMVDPEIGHRYVVERENQIAILLTLRHLLKAANTLTEFVRIVRPESYSGTIGTEVSDAIMKKRVLDDFRDKVAENDDIRIKGMTEIIRERQLTEDISNTELPEVIALNTAMGDNALSLFLPYFPEVKESWAKVSGEILGYYDLKSKKQKSRMTSKIVYEQVLWQLLSSDSGFITDEIKNEQNSVLRETPRKVAELNKRINKVKKQLDDGETVTDTAAEELINNAFLTHLSAKLKHPIATRRLTFSINGPAIEGMRDNITAGWNALMMSDDQNIRKLAVDLFKYNVFSNGLEYGMYEFSHFAPFSVLVSTPGYVTALQNMMQADFSDADTDPKNAQNFIDYYFRNHWNDDSFLLTIDEKEFIKHISEKDGRLMIPQSRQEIENGDVDILKRAIKKPYMNLRREDRQKQPYQVIDHGSFFEFIPVEKLGFKAQNGQLTLQYNPQVWANDMKPIITPIRQDTMVDINRISGDSDISGADDFTDTNGGAFEALVAQTNGKRDRMNETFANVILGAMGLDARKEQMKPVEEKAEEAVKENGEITNEQVVAAAQVENAEDRQENDAIEKSAAKFMNDLFYGKQLMIVHRTDDTVTKDKVPATPANILEARKQSVYVALNKKLREILREKGIAVGVLDDAEARLSIGGITDFDTAQVTAEGLLEMIRIAEGYIGEEALPEEFAHVAIEMLGYYNPLVQRLLTSLRNSDAAMREAYGEYYDEYVKAYGDNTDKFVLEAAGKLVAKHLFRQQEIQTSPIRALIHRICDAIKNLFRRFRRDEVQNAIFEANQLASKVAQGMFGGQLIDSMSLSNIRQSDQFLSIKTDLSGKQDLLSKLLKIESKRLAILKKRLGPDAEKRGADVISSTQTQIAKLEAAIQNYKTEDAVVTYMTDSLSFLAKTEASLDASIESGKKANDVCRKLNTVRDTLYSFSQGLEAVKEAIVDGEISDSEIISEATAKVQGVLSSFYIKYERLAKQYFEKMLSNVYGDDGVTVEIGKDRGRVITIQEMARKADSDIGFMSRWFHSIADCNDYVLMAVDDTTRKAKIRARQRSADVRPRIEKAVDDLVRETGSRDTSFMYEKKRYDGGTWCNKAEDDGKLHKTGYYIKKDSIEYKNLKPSQKAFYDTFMEIKEMADKCVPESLLKDGKIIMLRKYTMQRIKDAEGIENKILSAWDGIKNSILETSDDFDPNYEEVAVDFENNKVDRLPLRFLLRGKKEQYDDMTDDAASALVAYSGMAFEYDEVNSVINILENAKYMASERMITQRTGSKTKRETIDTDPDKDNIGIMFREPFAKRAIDSHAQQALEDFFQMHLYGHIHKGEGTFGSTRISKRKTVDTLNNITSLTQMAINIPQRIANVNTGMTQILIESVGKGHFNFKDLMWAVKTYMSYTGDRLVDMGKTDYDNKLSLFADKFDLHQNNGRNQTNYSKKNISRVINSSLLYAGLTLGEDALALCTSLALAHNKTFNVKSPDGKIETLFDAYEVRYTDSSNKQGAYLALKPGYTMADGTPIESKIGEMKESFEDKYAKLCAAMNFEMQGIYNLDDRSAIQQYAAGSLLIMYRKWIAPSLKRRYGGMKYNVMKGEYEEGYHRTMINFLWQSVKDAKSSITESDSALKLFNIWSDIKAFNAAVSMNWNKLTDYEKSNIRRAQAEISVVTGLYLACALSGKVPPRKKEDDPDYKPTWWDRQVMSQLFRLRSEIGSQAPTPMMVNEALHIMRSPFAAMGPITSTLNGFKLLIPSTYFNEIKSGRYKGHTKAYKYFRELPIIAAYKKIENFIDPTPLINYYKNEIVY